MIIQKIHMYDPKGDGASGHRLCHQDRNSRNITKVEDRVTCGKCLKSMAKKGIIKNSSNAKKQ